MNTPAGGVTLPELLQDYDWREAFVFASFPIDEVASIIATSEGQNDGDSWLAVGTLKNGQYFFLSAWCDYTGWDCQSGGDSEVADTLENLIRWNLGDEARDRLGFAHPTDPAAPLPKETP